MLELLIPAVGGALVGGISTWLYYRNKFTEVLTELEDKKLSLKQFINTLMKLKEKMLKRLLKLTTKKLQRKQKVQKNLQKNQKESIKNKVFNTCLAYL